MKPGNLVTVRLLPGNKPGLFWLRPHTAELLLHFLIHFSTWSLENPPSKSQSVYTHTHTHSLTLTENKHRQKRYLLECWSIYSDR